jgi:hypothetical protein
MATHEKERYSATSCHQLRTHHSNDFTMSISATSSVMPFRMSWITTPSLNFTRHRCLTSPMATTKATTPVASHLEGREGASAVDHGAKTPANLRAGHRQGSVDVSHCKAWHHTGLNHFGTVPEQNHAATGLSTLQSVRSRTSTSFDWTNRHSRTVLRGQPYMLLLASPRTGSAFTRDFMIGI